MCAGTHERKKSGIEVPEEGIAGFELTKVSARTKLRFSTRTAHTLNDRAITPAPLTLFPSVWKCLWVVLKKNLVVFLVSDAQC